jgi:hypothetical protein
MRTQRMIYLFFVTLSLSSGLLYGQASKPFILESARFRITFPGQASYMTQNVNTALGELEARMNYLEPGDTAHDANYLYMVVESTYPDSVVRNLSETKLNSFFEGAISGMMKQTNGEVKSNKVITSGGYPGRLVEVDYQKGTAVVKVMLVLRDNYFVIVQTFTNPKNYPNKGIDDFFDSLEWK